VDVFGYVAGAVLALVAVDRAVAHGWIRRRRPRDRPPRTGAGAGGSGFLGDLVEVFQPSQRHVAEERSRRQSDRQDAGDGAPGVDLDAGTAWLDEPPRG
jgi:hypothetical protein